ncbi:23548_t:CDS:1, partial [Gigaspora rosea]
YPGGHFFITDVYQYPDRTFFWQLNKEGNDKRMYEEFLTQGGLVRRRMRARWKECYSDSHD